MLKLYKEKSDKSSDPEIRAKFTSIHAHLQKGFENMSDVREMGICLGESGQTCQADTDCESFNCKEKKCKSGSFGEFMKTVGKGVGIVAGGVGSVLGAVAEGAGNFFIMSLAFGN